MTDAKEQRYTLAVDDACHDYIIPVEKVAEWDRFNWEEDPLPDWARPVGGSLCRLSFTNPVLK